MDAGIQNMVAMAQMAPQATAPKPTASEAKADWAAKEYEAVFISQFLGSMVSGIGTDTLTGGGQGEEMFRSLMINEYGKSIVQGGGFGLAAQMKAQLLKHQEAAAP